MDSYRFALVLESDEEGAVSLKKDYHGDPGPNYLYFKEVDSLKEEEKLRAMEEAKRYSVQTEVNQMKDHHDMGPVNVGSRSALKPVEECQGTDFGILLKNGEFVGVYFPLNGMEIVPSRSSSDRIGALLRTRTSYGHAYKYIYDECDSDAYTLILMSLVRK